MATAAALTAAGISVTNSLEKKANPSQDVVQAATTNPAATTTQTQPIQQNVQAQTPQQQFLNQAVPAATTASSTYGTYTSVMVAQAALESGWGQSGLAQSPNNNLFGIKGSYNGQSVNMGTTEYGSNGYYTTNDQFRKYPSYTESFNDNGALLRNGITGANNYYSGTWVENSNSGTQASQGLQGKYATDPQYAAKINQIIQANNLTQYDPVTKEVNETKTVLQDTPITNAPVDANVIGSIGTAKQGQQVNVNKYVTYGNGVSHALTNLGWINSSAIGMGTSSSQAPTNTSATTKPVTSQPTDATKATKPTPSSQAPATTKKEYIIHPVTEVVTVEGTGNAGLRVRNAPNGSATGQVLAEGTAWKVSGYVIADDNFRYNQVGTNQWVNDIYCSHLPVKNTSNNFDITKTKDIATVISPTSIPVWSAPSQTNGKKTGQLLAPNTRWKVLGTTKVKDDSWLWVGTNQWIESDKTVLDSQKNKPATTPVVNRPTTTNTTQNNVSVNTNTTRTSGVVTVNYRDDQAVTVWSQPGGQPTGKYLTNHTNWKFFTTKKAFGETWYNLGGNQWVPSKYVYVR